MNSRAKVPSTDANGITPGLGKDYPLPLGRKILDEVISIFWPPRQINPYLNRDAVTFNIVENAGVIGVDIPIRAHFKHVRGDIFGLSESARRDEKPHG